jgi:hypothetical protein
MQRELGPIHLVHKERHAPSRWLGALLRVVSFGAMSTYVTHYTTVLGHTIYLPKGWSDRTETERYVILRHEAVHLRQMDRYGRIWMGILYALPFFPIGFAWFRARIEWEAYAETLRAVAETDGLEAARHPKLRAHIVKQFTGAAYGFMWPFPKTIESWIDAELARIALGGGAR